MQGQAECIRNITDTLVNRTKNAIGIFYWEGTWISVNKSTYEENAALWEEYGSGWAASYSKEYDPSDAGQYYGGCACDNQAMFSKDGKPLESLKVFSLTKTGSKVEIKADAIQNVNLTIDLNAEIVLPAKVNAVMNNGEKREIDVVWKNADYDAMRTGGVKKYEITGDAGGMEAKCYVSMVEYNFLENYSFETGDGTGWTVNSSGKMDEIYVENKPSDSLTGSCHYHFWSAAKDSAEFTLEQKVENLPTGVYRYTVSIMGGDAGEHEVYSYVKINGVTVSRKPMEITVYNSWCTVTSDDISYTAGDEITVGIYVK